MINVAKPYFLFNIGNYYFSKFEYFDYFMIHGNNWQFKRVMPFIFRFRRGFNL